MESHEITLTVDEADRRCSVEPRTLLVHALREHLDVTSPKIGCESGKCGACTVMVDGQLVKSCLMLAVEADGRDVLTVQGIDDSIRTPVEEAFKREHGLQCGYCTPGMVLRVVDLLEQHTHPSRAEIRRALKGNICRCTGYHNVVDAVETAASVMDGTAPETIPDGRSREGSGV